MIIDFNNIDPNGGSGGNGSIKEIQIDGVSVPVVDGVANLPISTLSEAFSGTTLNAEVNKCYRASTSVDSLTVTLPAISDVTKVQSLIIYLSTGTTPNITFISADSKAVSYFESYAIEAGKEYEINVTFNGVKWIIAGTVIASAE